MPKSINRSRRRSRKGVKAANITPIQLSSPNSNSMTKLDELLNKYKDKPSLKSLNNYAKFLSLGFT